MGRLIDADALIERKFILHDMEELTHEEFERLVNEQPTAFDTENVVAELVEEKEIAEKEMEECIFKALPYHDSIEGKCIGINKAIEIVRKGGVE